MAGPSRRLVLDSDRFESHLSQLLGERRHPVIDMRADAYGAGVDNVCRVLSRFGDFDLIRDGMRAPLDAHGGPDPGTDWISGEQLFDLGLGKPGFTSLIGTVINVKRVPSGRRISYGYTYATTMDTTVALVALGYADGVLRRASNVADVYIGGHTGVIAGRIAMDQLVVDVGDVDVSPGEPAILWGDPGAGHPSIADLSSRTSVPALAIMTGVGPRVLREMAEQRGSTS